MHLIYLCNALKCTYLIASVPRYMNTHHLASPKPDKCDLILLSDVCLTLWSTLICDIALPDHCPWAYTFPPSISSNLTGLHHILLLSQAYQPADMQLPTRILPFEICILKFFGNAPSCIPVRTHMWTLGRRYDNKLLFTFSSLVQQLNI